MCFQLQAWPSNPSLRVLLTRNPDFITQLWQPRNRQLNIRSRNFRPPTLSHHDQSKKSACKSIKISSQILHVYFVLITSVAVLLQPPANLELHVKSWRYDYVLSLCRDSKADGRSELWPSFSTHSHSIVSLCSQSVNAVSQSLELQVNKLHEKSIVILSSTKRLD